MESGKSLGRAILSAVSKQSEKKVELGGAGGELTDLTGPRQHSHLSSFRSESSGPGTPAEPGEGKLQISASGEHLSLQPGRLRDGELHVSLLR